MQNRTKMRILGIAIIFIALLLGLANSFSITSLSISDSNPTTYSIVVMLMIFLFLLFYIKDNDLNPEKGWKNIVFGALLFALYVIMLSYSKVALSYLFLTYRLDLLFTPLLLLSMIVLIFGFKGARRMRGILIYSLFASPLLLLPVLNLNGQFALFNSYVVYDTLKLIGIPVMLHGLTITAPSSYSISIAETCSDIGAFAALVMFLLPLTYLFNGKGSRKVMWMVAAVALMLLLNIARMFSIAIIWAYYGITSAVATFHLFIGEVLFYIVIIVMFLLAYKFALYVPKISDSKSASKEKVHTKTGKSQDKFSMHYMPAFALCILFGLIAFLLSMPYSSSIYAQINGFSGMAPSSQSQTNLYVLSTLENAKSNITELGYYYGNLFFAIGGPKNSTNQSIILVNYTSKPELGALNLNYTSIGKPESIQLKNGITLNGRLVTSSNYTFIVNYFTVPYNLSDQYISIRYEIIRMTNSSNEPCTIRILNSTGAAGYMESSIYNFVAGSSSGNLLLCNSYMIANGINSTSMSGTPN